MTFFPIGKSDIEGAKIMASRSKKVFEYIWDTESAENYKHYEYLAKYVGFLTDFCFASRWRHCNPRYGWFPQLDV